MKIIIKVGTAAIFDAVKEEIKEAVIDQLAEDTSELIKRKDEIIIVTSGAVGCGKSKILGEDKIGVKQACAAVGQIILMSEYEKIFSKYKLHIAQFLINSKDLEEKNKIENLRETYKHIKENRIIPIVNENDVTSVEELKIGDNDTLASKLLLSLDFDILIILTEIGALIKNKNRLTESNFYRAEEYDSMKISQKGFGGLQSKLDAARNITHLGKICIIAKAGDPIIDILEENTPATKFK